MNTKEAVNEHGHIAKVIKYDSENFKHDNNNNNNNKLIRGTTSIFLQDITSTYPSFKKVDISSSRISKTAYPSLAAIQTIQFQNPRRNMHGHTSMIQQKGIWKLFCMEVEYK